MQFWGIMARLRVSQLDVEMDLKTTLWGCQNAPKMEPEKFKNKRRAGG